jgi:hypothetical protein
MNSKNNKKLFSLAIVLMLSMVASMMLVPQANAHSPPWQIPTFAYVQAVPNPVGVGQSAYVFMWVDKIPDGAQIGNDIRFHNYKLTITSPDGQTTTQTFETVSDPTSNQAYVFNPTQIGTYTFEFDFPAQTYTYTQPIPGFFGPPAPSQFINDTYMASSATTTLTVQQEQIPTIPQTPLPTNYWTRPIYGENSDWWTISSNWLGNPSSSAQGYGSVFPGDAVGPQTSHIMWTKPLQSGGVVGGNHFVIQGDTWFEGSAYNNKYTNPIILDGKLFYTEPVSFAGVASGPTVCVDLRTGKLIWSRSDIPALSFGYAYDVQDVNQKGVYPPIVFAQIGGGFFSPGPATWQAYDADTGTPMFNVTNIPTGTSAVGVNGEYLKYALTNYGNITNPQYYLTQWNSSHLWYGQYNGPSTSPSVVPPITDGVDPLMYDFNISMPALNTMPASAVLDAFPNNLVLCRSGSYPSGPSAFGAGSWNPYTYFAINLNQSKGAIGSILWQKTYDAPAGNITVSFSGDDPSAEVFVENYKEPIQFVGYSMATGEKLWGPTESEISFNYYSVGYNAGGNEAGAAYAYGRLYCGGFGGLLYCYDLKDGTLLWTYGNGGPGNSTSSGFEVPGYYPMSIYAIGNGIVYTTVTEHTVNTPIYKGGLARAINATDGTEVWTLSSVSEESGPPGTGAIADGYATFLNGYDMQIYVIGKGPSATTVDAPKTAIDLGKALIITGTVMDISTGTEQDQAASNFPNGVPVVSDASMKDWMAYVYQQQPCPATVTGVPVSLSVFDPNNNTYPIGTTTTDGDGTFALAWTPPVPGVYRVTATFAGSNGYFTSHATTAFLVTTPTAQAAIIEQAPNPIITVAPTAQDTQGSKLSSSSAQSISSLLSPLPSQAAQPTSRGESTTIYVAIAATVVIVVAIAATAIVLRKRR